MITLLSPAKTLDYDSPDLDVQMTTPTFALEANRLIRILKKKKVEEIKSLMHISDNLATLNLDRYKRFSKEYTAENSKSAIMAFKGDVYTGLEAETLSSDIITGVTPSARHSTKNSNLKTVTSLSI